MANKIFGMDKESALLTAGLLLFELVCLAVGMLAFGPLLVLNIALLIYTALSRREQSEKYKVMRLNLALALTAFVLLVLRLALGI